MDEKQNPVASEDMKQRVVPALDIIQAIMKRADELAAQRASKDKSDKSKKLEQHQAVEVQGAPKHVYVSLDGDNIGNAVARAEESDDEEHLKEISAKIESGQNVLVQWAARYGGKVIEAGGDEGLVKVPESAVEKIKELTKDYQKATGTTATVGVGSTISDSTNARALGKLRGKNQVVHWSPEMDRELKIRNEDQGKQTEYQKMKAAGLGGGKPQEPAKPAQETGRKARSPGVPIQDAPQQEPQEQKDPNRSQGEKSSARRPKKTEPKPDKPKAFGRSGNYARDPEIEKEDFSDRDNPEFAKRLWYAIKYGPQS